MLLAVRQDSVDRPPPPDTDGRCRPCVLTEKPKVRCRPCVLTEKPKVIESLDNIISLSERLPDPPLNHPRSSAPPPWRMTSRRLYPLMLAPRLPAQTCVGAEQRSGGSSTSSPSSTLLWIQTFLRTMINDNGASCLHFAVESGEHACTGTEIGDLPTVEMLMEAGREAGVQLQLLNARDSDGETCLHTVVENDKLEVVRALCWRSGGLRWRPAAATTATHQRRIPSGCEFDPCR